MGESVRAPAPPSGRIWRGVPNIKAADQFRPTIWVVATVRALRKSNKQTASWADAQKQLR